MRALMKPGTAIEIRMPDDRHDDHDFHQRETPFVLGNACRNMSSISLRLFDRNTGPSIERRMENLLLCWPLKELWVNKSAFILFILLNCAAYGFLEVLRSIVFPVSVLCCALFQILSPSLPTLIPPSSSPRKRGSRDRRTANKEGNPGDTRKSRNAPIWIPAFAE
jgi:hypothetical protein